MVVCHSNGNGYFWLFSGRFQRSAHESENDPLSLRKEVCNSLWEQLSGRFPLEAVD